MSGPRRAWVLNLDAEHELGARGPYAPDRHLRAIVARESARLVAPEGASPVEAAGALVGAADVVVTEEGLARWRAEHGRAPHPAAGLPGLAWSPTPRALALLRRAGALPLQAPANAVLATVNARPFATRVRTPLARACGSFDKEVATDLDQTLALLARPTPDGWLVRRTFGAAGRGRRRIAATGPRGLEAAEHAWLVASLRLGPLVVEPWVRVLREHTRSGWVERDGGVLVSAPCFQQTTREGAWLRTEAAERGTLSPADDARLSQALEQAGQALAAAGYFGPFGIDAFHHAPLHGGHGGPGGHGGHGPVLNPLSEINARFTMDWTTGMGARGSARLAACAADEALAPRS